MNLDSKENTQIIESTFAKKDASPFATQRLSMTNNNADSIKTQNLDSKKKSVILSFREAKAKYLNIANTESNTQKKDASHTLSMTPHTDSIESKKADSINQNAQSLRSVAKQDNFSVRSTQPLESRLSRGVKNRNQGDRSVAADFSQATEKRGSPPLRQKSGCFFSPKGERGGGFALFCAEDSQYTKSVLLKSRDHENLDSIQTASLDSKKDSVILSFRVVKAKYLKTNESQSIESKNADSTIPPPNPPAKGGAILHANFINPIESKKDSVILSFHAVKAKYLNIANIESMNLDSKENTQIIESKSLKKDASPFYKRLSMTNNNADSTKTQNLDSKLTQKGAKYAA